MTVFNTEQFSFASSYGNAFGYSPYFARKYKKRSDTSTLRIYWGGYIGWQFNYACIRLKFFINDQECQDPYPIETGFFQGYHQYGWDRAENGARYTNGLSFFVVSYLKENDFFFFPTVDGICRGLPAGLYDVRMYIDDGCKHGLGSAGGNREWFDIGHGRQSQMILEEIHENLPVNSLLMDDGQLVKLPNFNRRYQVFDTYCTGGDSTCYASDTHSMVYKKLNSDSHLHIKWYGTIETSQWEASPTFQTIKWFIVIDGVQCSDPGPIEIWQVRRNVVYGFHIRLPKYRKLQQ